MCRLLRASCRTTHQPARAVSNVRQQIGRACVSPPLFLFPPPTDILASWILQLREVHQGRDKLGGGQ